jgi:hypothetical protein
MIWLSNRQRATLCENATGRLMPDFKTIADFRKTNGEAIRKGHRTASQLNREAQSNSGINFTTLATYRC